MKNICRVDSVFCKGKYITEITYLNVKEEVVDQNQYIFIEKRMILILSLVPVAGIEPARVILPTRF